MPLSDRMWKPVSGVSGFGDWVTGYREEERTSWFWERKREARAKRCRFARTRTSQSTSSSKISAVVRFSFTTLLCVSDGVYVSKTCCCVPLQSVHMRPPASSNAYWESYVLLWWWICTAPDAVSSHSIDELELDIARGS